MEGWGVDDGVISNSDYTEWSTIQEVDAWDRFKITSTITPELYDKV